MEHKCWTTLSPEKFEIFVIPFKRSEQLDKEENTTEKVN